jgi:hypothetical protein
MKAHNAISVLSATFDSKRYRHYFNGLGCESIDSVVLQAWRELHDAYNI